MSAQPVNREEYGPAAGPAPFERGTDGPRVVLVGVDGSRTSLRAAAYAAGLARRQRSRLAVVYVATTPGFGALALAPAMTAIQETQEAVTAELRRECRRGADELGLPITFLSRRGDAYAEIRATADELRADLVVVGASEQAGHRLAGSIANRLVRCGRWPVVVVP
ncbi:universal stress protein [Plantactinospora sp. KBS50]|uniref:universal stress protein n=1 Tax=Plantactinospora sp. KBS50 TaxID=2024580 RepID=UPI000BAADA85|nr:universal stress protein [Plantactinospora sp. KBS50]ASW53996.1 universal stress protein UspA [Plantactinospora sp. KBS50]